MHFKLGRESSLVWVTGFTDGRPVTDAALRITDGCTGASLWRGRSDKDGLARVAVALPAVDGCSRPHYLVTARKDAHHGFVPPEPWPGEKEDRYLKGHSILDRALLQPGDTLSMKHFLRRETSDGFALPDPSMRSVRLSIRHRTLGEVHTEPVVLDATGIGTSTFEVPDDVFLGSYDVILGVADAVSTSPASRNRTRRPRERRAGVGQYLLEAIGSHSRNPARRRVRTR